MSADERSRSVCAGSTLDATSGAFMFPAWRIQPVPDGFILLVLRNHLEDLIPPLALVQVQPPPAQSAVRHHCLTGERNKRAGCTLVIRSCGSWNLVGWFSILWSEEGSGRLRSTQSSCVRLTLLSAQHSRRYKCAFVRSPPPLSLRSPWR